MAHGAAGQGAVLWFRRGDRLRISTSCLGFLGLGRSSAAHLLPESCNAGPRWSMTRRARARDRMPAGGIWHDWASERLGAPAARGHAAGPGGFSVLADVPRAG